MRKLFIICSFTLYAAICFPVQGSAEDKKFKIEDFIPEYFEDFEWKVASQLNLSGYRPDSKTEWPDTYEETSRTTEEDRTEWGGNLSTDLLYRYETVSQFLDLDLDFGGRFKRSGSESLREEVYSAPAGSMSASESTDKTVSLNFSSAVRGGKYLVGDFFASLEPSVNFSYTEIPENDASSISDQRYYSEDYFVTRRTTRSTERSSEQKTFKFSINALHGWGRLYVGVYASTAMYMIEELRGNGVLLREPSPDEMIDLCKIIYKNRLQHAVDERIRRIETFDEILGYLGDKGLSDATGHYGYLLIQDVWDYFPKAHRAFGFRVSAGVGCDYKYYRYRSTSDNYSAVFTTRYHVDTASVVDTVTDGDSYYYRSNTTIKEEYDRFARGLVEYSKPLSRRWQLTITGDGRYYFSSWFTEKWNYVRVSDGSSVDSHGTGDGTVADRIYQMSISGTLDYIYSSRTSMSLTVSDTYEDFDADETKGWDTGTDAAKRTANTLRLGGSLDYRISIPTTLSISAQYIYSRPHTISCEDVDVRQYNNNYSLSVSLEHYLY